MTSKYTTPWLFQTDGYKVDHRRQYPKGTTYVYSNLTPRNGRDAEDKGVIFFGLQFVLERYFNEQIEDGFFNRPKQDVMDEYQLFLNEYLGPNDIGVDHIAALWDLGYLPLEIKAVPEGTFVPYGVPVLTIENTVPEFFWVTNYIETLISSALWHATTSATTAFKYRKLLEGWALKTAGDTGFVDFQGHDFSFRGQTSPESAALSGAAHLTAFVGTDTIPAIHLLKQYYEATGMVGVSVAATEHSVMCAGGEDDELETYDRLLDLYPTGILSVVSDTWDYWNVLTKILPALKDKIVARGGKLVIRPDSGDPVKIICGDPDAPLGSPERKGTVAVLFELFGGTETSTGHGQLDEHIGVIYGDSITLERAEAICAGLAAKGYASTNVVFGIGSYTYQYCTRDNHGFAMKATWCEISGSGHDIFKKPKTDNGGKFSAKGRLAVLRDGLDGELYLIQGVAHGVTYAGDYLQTVWFNGEAFNTLTLEEVRANLCSEVARARV